MSVDKSETDDLSRPVHGADVELTLPGSLDKSLAVKLRDTTAVIDGDTSSFYFAPFYVIPGLRYLISVSKDGYPTAAASVVVPDDYVTIPDQDAYSAMMNPSDKGPGINIVAHLSNLASAAFVQMIVEYRGLDASGNFHTGFFDVTPLDTLNPFSEIGGSARSATEITLPMTIGAGQYKAAFDLARKSTDSLTNWHMYVDIVVTQVDDNLYRYFITANREVSPLLMRTDKIIFTDIFDGAGTGVVAGASVDTTRVFLF